MYDLLIIGGGPAGTAAGVYAARKKLSTLLVTETFGGQSDVSDDIQNWVGTVSISGPELGKAFRAHLDAYAGEVLDIEQGKKVSTVERGEDESFTVETDDGSTYKAKTVLAATGSHRRKLKVPGASEFENKGITYCASCDGPIFSGQDVVIVGGGNAGFESAAQLLEYANSVTLLQRSERFKADPVTVEAVLENEKMTAYKNAEISEIRGENFVTGVSYTDKDTGENHDLDVGGVFVEIGLIPTTGMVGDMVELNDNNQIKIDESRQRTSVEGIWAAGDCTDVLYHQNNIAAGDGVKALEDIYLYLRAQKSK